MNKSILILILISSIVQILYSQNEAIHWYFGEGSSLDFSNGSLELDPK